MLSDFFRNIKTNKVLCKFSSTNFEFKSQTLHTCKKPHYKDVAPSHPHQIPFSSLQQVERLICPSSQGDLPAINAPQIEPQKIHLFQQKAAAAKRK